MVKKVIFPATLLILLLNLAGCTQAGLGAGLLGSWKSTGVTIDGQDMSSTMTVEIEFRKDDSFKKTEVVTTGVTSIATTKYGKVIKVEAIKKTITVKNSSDDSETVYSYELLSEKLKIEYNEGAAKVATEMDKG